jgi:hypothetical protein
MRSSRNPGKYTLFAARRRAKRRGRVVLPSIALLGAGTVLAAAAAFLLAPRSTSDLRRELSDAAKQLRRRIDERVKRTPKSDAPQRPDLERVPDAPAQG